MIIANSKGIREGSGLVEIRPISPYEFQMAYQVRVAIERLRFAIKHTEQFGSHNEPMLEVAFQLLDALQRLENVDRQFQERSRTAALHR